MLAGLLSSKQSVQFSHAKLVGYSEAAAAARWNKAQNGINIATIDSGVHRLQTQVQQDLREQRDAKRPALYGNSNSTIFQGERQRCIQFIGTQIP